MVTISFRLWTSVLDESGTIGIFDFISRDASSVRGTFRIDFAVIQDCLSRWNAGINNAHRGLAGSQCSRGLHARRNRRSCGARYDFAPFMCASRISCAEPHPIEVNHDLLDIAWIWGRLVCLFFVALSSDIPNAFVRSDGEALLIDGVTPCVDSLRIAVALRDETSTRT
ncbi:hypothetical protein SCHPADRAFT_53718 [Schizopora paradoxa]|uniref:Uncharacterized protein n=1 Tax=Schizopora paradoxa TaxID=27342 RepID=A0A0H2S6S8_9AGAM|nr:hypothetical protein SCHPADRAFT_53718 [Schizopora paradoxa]